MLVVTDELSDGVGRESGLAGSRETKEEGDVTVGSLVGRGVERELSELDGLEVMLS